MGQTPPPRNNPCRPLSHTLLHRADNEFHCLHDPQYEAFGATFRIISFTVTYENLAAVRSNRSAGHDAQERREEICHKSQNMFINQQAGSTIKLTSDQYMLLSVIYD